MLASPSHELPQGPPPWARRDEGSSPLTQTQKSTPQPSSHEPSSHEPSNVASLAALTSTQKTPASHFSSNQRQPSAAYPEIDVAIASATPAELRRPEMRSPSPRPAGTPRSLWVPVLVMVILGLAGTALWLWFASS